MHNVPNIITMSKITEMERERGREGEIGERERGREKREG
jgi:hypothetical protein